MQSRGGSSLVASFQKHDSKGRVELKPSDFLPSLVSSCFEWVQYSHYRPPLNIMNSPGLVLPTFPTVGGGEGVPSSMGQVSQKHDISRRPARCSSALARSRGRPRSLGSVPNRQKGILCIREIPNKYFPLCHIISPISCVCEVSTAQCRCRKRLHFSIDIVVSYCIPSHSPKCQLY